MNMQEIYLPARLWLREDEADRLRGKSSKTPFPEFDHSVAVSRLSYQQFTRDGILQLVPKGQTKESDTLSIRFEGKAPADLYDELFLPPEEKCIKDLRNASRPTAQPAARYLHPAQGLPRTEERLNGLPACLVAGYKPSQSAPRSPDVSTRTKKIHEAAGVAHIPRNQIPNSLKHRGGTSAPRIEWAKLSTFSPWSGQKSSTAQISDPVEFAQVSQQYDFNKQPENKDLQGNASLSYEIPPLPVGSPFRLSAVFPATPAGSRSIDENPQPLRAELHLPEESHDNVRYQEGNLALHDKSDNFPSSDMCKTQQRMPNNKHDQLGIPQIRFNSENFVQETNQSFQQCKSSSPEIPPVRVISALRFSGIFPNFPATSATTVSSAQAGSHQSGKISTTGRPRQQFPSSFDGSYDDAIKPKEQKNILRREPAGSPGQETFHKRIHRCKGYENLRVAYIPHKLPPLVASSPMAFPDLI